MTDRRPTFIILAWGFAAGGTRSVLVEWVPRLARHGEVLAVLHDAASAPLDIPTHVVGGRASHPMRFPQTWLYVARLAIGAARVARRSPGPVVLLAQDSLATGAAGALAARLSGATSVLMEHGSAEAIRTSYFWRERFGPAGRLARLRHPLLRASIRLLHRVALRGARLALVAGDEAAAVYRTAGYPAERIARYHFAVDLDRFRPPTPEERSAARHELGLAPDELAIVSVSRLAPEKGLDDLLAALDAAGPAARLLLAGEGRERARLEAAAGPGVTFLGERSAGQVAGLLRAADIFVYAGRQGANTPYAVLEAMVAGLPVIASTAPEVHAAMLADGRGRSFAPGDRAALASALRELAADPDLCARLGAAARAYVERVHAPAVLDAEVGAFVSRALQAGGRMPR